MFTYVRVDGLLRRERTAVCPHMTKTADVDAALLPPAGRRGGRRSSVALALAVGLLTAAAASGPAPLDAQSLRGGRAAVNRAYRVAQDHDFTFLRTGAQVRRFVQAGYLVRVRGNADFGLAGVSYPYARPEVELFLRRFAAQYRAGCGERLVVTSLTRPLNRQPRNASDRSVHPTGMAVDLRRPATRRCRQWMERVLLQLEGAGVLEATKERRPPHYHVSLFPRPYRRYVDALRTRAVATAGGTQRYRVQAGDSLWEIARAYGTTIETLKAINGLSGSRIYPGQVLSVPSR